jgi:DNA-3-methyladenine glycosylase I
MKRETAVKDSKVRCAWCTSDEVYIEYHDKEWGVPVHDDQKLFEFIVLESFQLADDTEEAGEFQKGFCRV